MVNEPEYLFHHPGSNCSLQLFIFIQVRFIMFFMPFCHVNAFLPLVNVCFYVSCDLCVRVSLNLYFIVYSYRFLDVAVYLNMYSECS